MICPNCKVKLVNNSKYCPRCGTLFESNDVKKYSEAFNTDFMEIYFPNKELKFHIDRLSIGYMLFTYFYAIYKKMYNIALKSFLLQLFIFVLFKYGGKIFDKSLGAMFFPVMFAIIGVIIIYFYYIFNFDRLLIENRTFRVNKIIRENENKSKDELIDIMEKDSHNNIKGMLITLLVIITYILFKLII